MMPDKRLMAMVPEARKYIILKVLMNWLSLIAGVVFWFSLVGQLENVRVGKAVSAAAFAVAGVCVVCRFVLTRVITGLTHQAASCVKLTIRSAIYDKVRRLGVDYNRLFPTSEIVQLAGEGVEQLETYFGNYIPQLFFAVLAPLTLLIVYFPLSPLTAVVLFLCVPLIPVAIVKVQRFAKKLLGKYWDAYANLGDSFLENLQGLTTLKVYSADEQRHREMNEESEHFRKVTMKVLTMQLNSVTIMDFVAYGGSALGCILAACSFSQGNVNFGQALAMVMLSSEFFLAMRTLGSYFHTAMNGAAAADRMFRLFDLPEEADGSRNMPEGDLRVEYLTFSYDGEKNALEDVSLTIPQDSLVSVVGESGCGKSTLAEVLSRQHLNYEGSVTVGDVELKELSAESLRRRMTVVTGGSYLFAGTVRETLLEGKDDASEEEMKEVLRKVALWEFVESRGGLEFRLKERASNLSGGQRQRLALARALLKNSPVYIFDEATSNIDAESENAILSVIRQMKGSHTLLMISHRLANVVDSDAILYMEKGKGTELGSHQELMVKQGGYAAMFRAQQELEQYGVAAVKATSTSSFDAASGRRTFGMEEASDAGREVLA